MSRRDPSIKKKWMTHENLPIWFAVMFAVINPSLVRWIQDGSWTHATGIGLTSCIGGYAGGRLGQRFFGKRYRLKEDPP